MLTGLPLFLLILVVLLLIVAACTLWKAHPFLVLLTAAIVLGLGAGMPAEATLTTLLQGGGAVFTSIGFIIALGTLLGEILEKTGAVHALAGYILRKGGTGNVLGGMSVLGALVGVPVFCDSGFVILSNLARSLARTSSLPVGALSLALATGLYTTHVLVPPTPGPLAAAGNLGMADHLGWVILLGLAVSIPSVLIGWWFARRVPQGVEDGQPAVDGERLGNLPSFGASLLPLLLPVLLIALGSGAHLLSLPSGLKQTILFICNPNCALLLGVALAFGLLGRRRKNEWNGWIQEALSGAGPIILITAAGGALGAVLKATPLADAFRLLLAGKQLSVLYLFPAAYLLAAGLKTAQGSSTASLIITSSIIAPLLAGLAVDHPAQKALLVLSIGAGAMTVSHANDSYFWVISQYSRLPAGKMYRHFTVATFFMGLGVLLSCLLLGWLF